MMKSQFGQVAKVVCVLWCTIGWAQNAPNNPPGDPPVKPPAADATAAPAPAAPPAPEMVAIPLPSPAMPPAKVPTEPLAGYSNGGFFLRDPKDWFVLFPKGRLQIDWYNFLNRGELPAGTIANSAADPRPKDTLFVRRARIELQGTFFKHFDFHIASEFASAPATGSTGIVGDAYVIVDYLSFLKAQIGQFDVPFSLENRTSDKYIDFMERSVTVRAFAVPANKDQGAMVFGWLPKKVAYYSLGIFNGDGTNFRNQDNNPAVIGRAFVAPLAWMAKNRRWMEDISVGASFWWQRNTNIGGSVAPNIGGAAQDDLPGMTTQGGLQFFSPTYGNGTNSAGQAIRSHLAPWGEEVKWAIEANIPVKKVGLRFELIHQSVDLAQYNDTNPTNAQLVRAPGIRGVNLDGYAYYIELYGWILGDVNFIESPGLENAPRIKKFTNTPDPKWGLMLAAKYEHVGFGLTGLPAGPLDMSGTPSTDPAQGNYEMHVFEAGVNAWATKHVRLTGNYVMNYIDGDAALVKRNFYYHKAEHELLFRVGINL